VKGLRAIDPSVSESGRGIGCMRHECMAGRVIFRKWPTTLTLNRLSMLQ
jgi:ABC-type proline/glycine betaine transport system permease subunit